MTVALITIRRALLIASVCIGQSHALDYSVDFSSFSRADSDGLKDGSERDEVYSTTALELTLDHDGQRLDFSGSYSAQFADYTNGTNSDRTSFDGSSEFNAELLAQRMNWLASHTVADISPSRRVAADISDDRQQRHQLSTGPLVTLPLSAVDQLVISANYSEILFNDAENEALNADKDDSSSISAGANWLHSLSSIAKLVGGYQFQQFEPDSADPKIDFQRVYLGYQRALRTLEYGINIGSNTSKREGGSSSNGLFYQADISKKSGGQTFSASISRQKTESSLGLSNLRLSAAPVTADQGQLNASQTYDNANNDGVVEINFASLDYTASALCNLCSYGLELSFTDSDYEAATAIDDRVSEARVFYSYRITQQLSARLTGGYSSSDFVDLNQQDVGTSAELGLSWNPSPRLQVNLTGGYEEEDADTGNNFYNGYGGIGFTYNLYSSPTAAR